jgi:hypothetical protein
MAGASCHDLTTHFKQHGGRLVARAIPQGLIADLNWASLNTCALAREELTFYDWSFVPDGRDSGSTLLLA